MTRIFEDEKLRNRKGVFRDRTDAGRRLGKSLSRSILPAGIVLAIPAGGVPVALEISHRLRLPMDLLIVRKMQIPDNPEAGFGAVGPDGEVIFNENLMKKLDLTSQQIRMQVEKTQRVIEERNRVYRAGRPFPSLEDLPGVILVDDGLASGFTVIAAVRFLKKKGGLPILVAVPTSPEDTLRLLLPLADEIHCPNVRTSYPFAVADAYRNWYDLPDTEVMSLVGEGR
jgi:putative phosphoribosyl transferase